MAGITLECLRSPEILMVFESIKYISTFLNQKNWSALRRPRLSRPEKYAWLDLCQEYFNQVNKVLLLLWLSHCHCEQLCYYYEREESPLGHFSGPVMSAWLTDQSATEEKSLARERVWSKESPFLIGWVEHPSRHRVCSLFIPPSSRRKDFLKSTLVTHFSSRLRLILKSKGIIGPRRYCGILMDTPWWYF